MMLKVYTTATETATKHMDSLASRIAHRRVLRTVGGEDLSPGRTSPTRMSPMAQDSSPIAALFGTQAHTMELGAESHDHESSVPEDRDAFLREDAMSWIAKG